MPYSKSNVQVQNLGVHCIISRPVIHGGGTKMWLCFIKSVFIFCSFFNFHGSWSRFEFLNFAGVTMFLGLRLPALGAPQSSEYIILVTFVVNIVLQVILEIYKVTRKSIPGTTWPHILNRIRTFTPFCSRRFRIEIQSDEWGFSTNKSGQRWASSGKTRQYSPRLFWRFFLRRTKCGTRLLFLIGSWLLWAHSSPSEWLLPVDEKSSGDKILFF